MPLAAFAILTIIPAASTGADVDARPGAGP
jgi:hypothetical protein